MQEIKEYEPLLSTGTHLVFFVKAIWTPHGDALRKYCVMQNCKDRWAGIPYTRNTSCSTLRSNVKSAWSMYESCRILETRGCHSLMPSTQSISLFPFQIRYENRKKWRQDWGNPTSTRQWHEGEVHLQNHMYINLKCTWKDKLGFIYIIECLRGRHTGRLMLRVNLYASIENIKHGGAFGKRSRVSMLGRRCWSAGLLRPVAFGTSSAGSSSSFCSDGSFVAVGTDSICFLSSIHVFI